MPADDIILIPNRSDNYIYLLRCPNSGVTAVIDPGDAAPVIKELSKRGWSLDIIINTHHHNDHVGGNAELKQKFGAKIICPTAEAAKIGNLDETVAEGDVVKVGDLEARIYDVPGHTAGHIAFYFPAVSAVFSGDSLFALGCGRLFEGTAEQMWHSLIKFRTLPVDTRLYCGHEYTLSNARFALTIEPENAALQARASAIETLRKADRPTIPSTIGEEIDTNPFLRADVPAVGQAMGMSGAPAEIVFTEIRHRKDNF
ncbi:hydroxyacylglutathione hydrolase [Thalassospira sp. TSL5-1]|uniref:hydroxyacylglutathione hydrolase n=1 Tax=Thalassospira sp. TSL5-1 TaxID=1544451 RepID=UPI00093A26DB|nr:hydroxyacylglutathione hydrolase [Thalassospira sp. TSL5-1]OKH88000.1 hydroxyacylglutathione hydrolase [Thalassospira sp. TSL5-1]